MTTATRQRPARPGLYATPPLATCSYWDYQPGMGTPVAISPPPHTVRLPDDRWTSRTAWPRAKFLIPRGYLHHKKHDMPEVELAAWYLRDLTRVGPATIANGLRDLPVEDGRLVLLCHERSRDVLADPWACHRRWFADYWQDLTGMDVPELTTQ